MDLGWHVFLLARAEDCTPYFLTLTAERNGAGNKINVVASPHKMGKQGWQCDEAKKREFGSCCMDACVPAKRDAAAGQVLPAVQIENRC